jgi:hypothetical protein
MIEVKCVCGKSFRVNDSHAGKKAKCKTCGAVLRFPQSVPAHSLAVASSTTTGQPNGVPRPKRVPDNSLPTVPDQPFVIDLAPPAPRNVPISDTRNVPERKQIGPLAVAAFVFAMSALLMCGVPFIDGIAIKLGIASLALGTTDLITAKYNRHKTLSWSTFSTAAAAIAISIAALSAYQTRQALDGAFAGLQADMRETHEDFKDNAKQAEKDFQKTLQQAFKD